MVIDHIKTNTARTSHDGSCSETFYFYLKFHLCSTKIKKIKFTKFLEENNLKKKTTNKYLDKHLVQCVLFLLFSWNCCGHLQSPRLSGRWPITDLSLTFVDITYTHPLPLQVLLPESDLQMKFMLSIETCL